MTIKEVCDMVLNINEKFYTNKDTMNEDYFNVLHSCLYEMVRTVTEENYLKLPQSTRFSLEKLEEEIFNKTSNDYKKQYEAALEVHGRFYKRVEVNKKEKRKIGFVLENEEGTTI